VIREGAESSAVPIERAPAYARIGPDPTPAIRRMRLPAVAFPVGLTCGVWVSVYPLAMPRRVNRFSRVARPGVATQPQIIEPQGVRAPVRGGFGEAVQGMLVAPSATTQSDPFQTRQ
jgi:hypothetical protein